MKICALTAALTITSCTSVTFFEENPDGSMRKTGVKYYTPKPYLLVTRSGEDQKTVVAVKEVFLPDLAKPQYGVHRPGWGKSNFSFKLANGTLTEFSNNFDSQGAEAVTALGGLATSYGALLKSVEEANVLKNKALQKESGGLAVPEAARSAITDAAINIKQSATANQQIKPNPIASVEELNTLWAKAKALDDEATAATNSTMAESVSANSKQLVKLIDSSIDSITVPSDSAQSVLGPLKIAKNKLGSVPELIEKANPTPKPTPPPIFELYEIKMDRGKTTLEKVNLPS